MTVWQTTRRREYNGVWQPAGIRVKEVRLAGTGGRHGEHNRDGGSTGDGRRFIVISPSGVRRGEVRTWEQLTTLGIDLDDLEEVS